MRLVLPFRYPMKLETESFMGYAYKHVYVIGHDMRLDDVYPFVHAASPDVLPDVDAQFLVNRLPPVLGR